MIRVTLLMLLCIVPLGLVAQFNDDFSDGDFTSNPQWTGDTDKFIVDNEMLRLNDTMAGQAYLSVSSSVMDNTQWEFVVRIAFTPSTNNHPRIYLVSDTQDLHSGLNGYFIRIGKDGTDNKRLYFCRQDGMEVTELMAGEGNIASATNNILRIKAIRDDEGNWEFFADPTGGQLFIPQGQVHDDTHISTSWFGVKCIYTVSNSNRFYFDDFYAGDIIHDTVPLLVNYINVVSADVLEVHFSKAVEPLSAQTVSNYFVNKGIGHPIIASCNPLNPSRVSLFFATMFTEKQAYELQVLNVTDYSGNIVTPFTGEFVFYRPVRFDVVFNEIMADPDPPVGLPAFEYIELYNTSAFPINIEGWTLVHDNSPRVLPFGIILPGDYILLTTQQALPFLQHYGNVVAVDGLPAAALVNSGSTLLLYDKVDALVAFLTYNHSWYKNPAKASGGWSIEKVDPYNYCQGSENWRASEDPNGGTPAQPNSIMGNNPDLFPPDLIRAGYTDPQSVTLHFSEPMDEASLLNINNYYLKNLANTAKHWNPYPIAVNALLPDFSRAELTFEQPMQQDVIYEIMAGNQLTDCAANPLARNIAKVAIPRDAAPMDIVINELLFNPPEGGARYAELFNTTQNKVFDLKHHIISSKDTIEGFLTSVRELSNESYLMFPGEYVVVSSDPQAVKKTFMTPNPYGFIATDGFPVISNTSGIMVLANKSLEITDMFVYTEDMHLPLLADKKGVALERLNPYQPTQDRFNWHSAAANAGFGTPAYQNSQYTAYHEALQDKIELYPDVFSPDNDGFDDLLSISYSFEKPGQMATIRIFDNRGRLVRLLTYGELMSTKGVLTWNGITDDNQKAAVGVYLIHVEVFDKDGNVRHHKLPAVLGGRLK